MIRKKWLAICGVLIAASSAASADVVLDWNETLRKVIQDEGAQTNNGANPGWSTRSMAMANGAIYDTFQAFNRTHAPFLVNTAADPLTASLDAAVHTAAYQVMLHCYGSQSPTLLSKYDERMATVSGSAGSISSGVLLGQQIAAAYIANRTGDNADLITPYTAGPDPGDWRPDPIHGRPAWGPGWGTVASFAVPHTAPGPLNDMNDYIDALPGIPGMSSQAYTDAFTQVRDKGVATGSTRTEEETEIGIFWGYDRPTMGPPPVLFLRNLNDIALQTNNSAAKNARLFAMASVAMADAAIASWDAKFNYNFWRPIAGIREAGNGTAGDNDGNANTAAIADWRPLGAPGDPNIADSDFTPPFPAWPSGHATMGGALFETLKLFYGTNEFADIPGVSGSTYYLESQEMDMNDLPLNTLPAGFDDRREFSTFSSLFGTANFDEDSPEWENAISRVYLGVHWIFDAEDGILLGNDVAQYMFANGFQAVPEPSAALLMLMCAAGFIQSRRRR